MGLEELGSRSRGSRLYEPGFACLVVCEQERSSGQCTTRASNGAQPTSKQIGRPKAADSYRGYGQQQSQLDFTVMLKGVATCVASAITTMLMEPVVVAAPAVPVTR